MVENRFGVVTNYTYTSAGDLASRRDARGHLTSYLSHFRGIAQTENQPEGVTIRRTVSAAGNVTSATDGESRTTGYDYDGLNRITAIRRPVGNPVGVAWAANSRTVTRGALRELTVYDLFGREGSVTATDLPRGESIAVTHGYDVLSRRVFTSYPNGAGVGTGYQYDMLGRPTRVFQAFRNTSSFDASRQYSYSGADVTLTNERGLNYQYRYRAFGDPESAELMRLHTPVSASDVFVSRNKLGHVTSVTQDGATRTLHYDSRFFVDFSIDPEIGRVDYGRDAVGNMSSRQVAGGPLASFFHDGRNRLRTETYPAGTRNVTREYYRTDKLRSVDNGLARREYVYDPNDNLQRETLASGGRTWAIDYAYNTNDALQRITHGVSGLGIDYAPDGFGRPTRVGAWVTNVLHHASGALRSMTYANGVVTDVRLDGRLRPDLLQVRSGSPFFTLGYGYDKISNVQSITDSVDGSLSRTLGYDGVDRLTVASSPAGPGSVTYDGRGNITSQTFPGLSLTYAYNPTVNRLTSITGGRGWTFSYDAQGNVTNDGSTAFSYDAASLMRCARCGQPDEVLYDYDGAGLRVSQVRNGQATLAMHGFGGNLMWELLPGGLLKEYVYLGAQQVVVRETGP
jgi:YD repeat-containing protein